MSIGIIVKNYEHYSNAFGKYISSKKQYDYEMKKGGYVPYEQGCDMAKSAKIRKDYIPSKKAIEIVNTAIDMQRQGRGKENMPSTMRKGIEALGMSFNKKHLPSHYKREGGGFENG